MPPLFLRFAPLLAAFALYTAHLAWLVAASLRETGGRLVFTIDDAYIHMAVARNFVENGVWGVTAESFTSAVSSIGWPLLLAFAYAVGGVGETAPLILNAFFALGVIVIADLIGRRMEAGAVFRFLLLSVLVLATPLAPIALLGMEHTFQIFTGLLLIAVVLPGGAKRPSRGALAAAAALTTLSRYEGLFLLAPLILLFLVRRRLADALVLGIAGIPSFHWRSTAP